MISKETLELLKSDVVFLDIDGTLTEYRYNGHVDAGDGTDNGQTVEETNNHVFLNSRPLESVIKTIERHCTTEYLFTLGHIRTEGEGLIMGIEELDKKEWLSKHCPFVNPAYRLFLDDTQSKAERINKICKRLGTQNAVLIDDKIDILREVEKMGYKALHISSLID